MSQQRLARPRLSGKRVALGIGVVLTLAFCLAPALWQVLASLVLNEAIRTIPNVYWPSPQQLTL